MKEEPGRDVRRREGTPPRISPFQLHNIQSSSLVFHVHLDTVK